MSQRTINDFALLSLTHSTCQRAIRKCQVDIHRQIPHDPNPDKANWLKTRTKHEDSEHTEHGASLITHI